MAWSRDPSGSSGGRPAVLLVEDEPALRKLAAEILTRAGYQVAAAGDGNAALRIWEDQGGAFALLLCDVILPGMSAADLAAELTRRDPALKVLFVSGYGEETIAEKGLLADDVELLEKPYTPSRLLERVERLLRG